MNNIKCYIPKESRDALMVFADLPFKHRLADEDLSNAILQPAIILEYKGNEPRKAFQGFGIYLLDYGTIGKVFVDVAIRKCYVYLGKGEHAKGLHRYGVDSAKIFPLTCKEFSACLGALNKKKGE